MTPSTSCSQTFSITTFETNQLLSLDSSLSELTLHTTSIELTCLGEDVSTLFKEQPLLPGVLLTQNNEFVGMISRRRFFEQMSRPFSLELFSRRPIYTLYEYVKADMLVLPAETPIVEAARKAIGRSSKQLHEPIVVQIQPHGWQLLDMHQLLLAQSRIHELTLEALLCSQQALATETEAIANLKKTQIQLVQTEKMSSLGQLVAGIAHEINNPVNFIYGNINYANRYIQDLLDLLQRYQTRFPNPGDDIQQVADTIDLEFLLHDLPKLMASMKMGTDRIREIVKSLRNFSRIDEAEVKRADIHDGIDSTLVILQHRLKPKPDRPEIQLIKDYGNLSDVECYPGQLNQVFMNILTNAIDALDETAQDGASHSTTHNSAIHDDVTNELDEISTETSTETLDENMGNNPGGHGPCIWIRTSVVEPDRVLIFIGDNGPGMTEEVRRQLFDPFFTTKPVGQGTGLGLSISYQIIVERHNGQLQCCSELGHGTEFRIEIPIRQSEQ